MSTAVGIPAGGAGASAAAMAQDRRLLLWLGGALLLLIVGVSILHPRGAEEDPRPTTYNTGPQGAEAAFLTLQQMGVPVSRWERPLKELEVAQARHTTLVFADPIYEGTERAEIAEVIHGFLLGGGHVLVTGTAGAALVGGEVGMSHLFDQLCETTPEGPGPLSAAGSAQLDDAGGWLKLGGDARGMDNTQTRVEQRCGPDPVVVRLPVAATTNGGELIWWTSAYPLTNSGLKNDGNLRLLLASLGEGRAVIFDESLHNGRYGAVSVTGDLPLRSLMVQAVLLGLLLIFSFSRRRGPLRAPVELPRSSPVEFADSMGDLYRKANATGAATEAARRSLEQALLREARLPRATVAAGPAAIAEALQARYGGDWSALAQHLEEAGEAAREKASPRTALALVQALYADAARLREARGARPAGVAEP